MDINSSVPGICGTEILFDKVDGKDIGFVKGCKWI